MFKPSPDEAETFVVEAHGIRATSEGLFEIDSGRLMVFIPRAEVLAISLQHGRVAQRPLAQGILAAVLIVLGLSPLPWLVRWSLHGGTIITQTLWIRLRCDRSLDVVSGRAPRAAYRGSHS